MAPAHRGALSRRVSHPLTPAAVKQTNGVRWYRDISTRAYSEPEMGFEPMTCALRGPSKASSWVPPVRNASHKGRSTGVKLETVAIRCNSLRRPETQLLGQNSLFPS
jgi:hypothetical protein